jgi:hypothetical protein
MKPKTIISYLITLAEVNIVATDTADRTVEERNEGIQDKNTNDMNVK